jgi:HEAT repeats
MSSSSIKVTVVEDRVALDAANCRLRDREKDDPFAEHVAKVYSIDPIVQSAFDELLNDDPKISLEGIYHLRVKRLPPGGGDRLKAVVKTLCRSDRKTDPKILREISFNCRAIEADEAVDVMAIIANSAPNVDISRTGAVVDLAMVPGPHAEKVLLDLVANKDSPVYWEALAWLGSRHNKAVIQPLLATAADPKSEKRLVAIRVLGRFFRDRPDATSALDAALHDNDREVRKTAKEAIEWKDIDPEMLSDW